MPQSTSPPVGLAGPEISLRGSSFANLAPEIQGQMYRRFGGLGVVYAVAWFANFLFFRFSPDALGPTENVAFWDAMTALCVGSGIAIYVCCRKRWIPPRMFMNVATVFEVLAGLGIIIGVFGFETDGEAFLTLVASSLGISPDRIVPEIIEPLDREGLRLLYLNGVTWVSVWLLVFPLLIPASFGRTAVSAFLTASTVPAVMLTSIWLHGVPPSIETLIWPYFLEVTIPTFICAGIAVFASRVVYTLTRDLSKARRMGSYHLEERIGVGGMGEVWTAEHRLLARTAAIKLIRPEALGRDDGARQTAIRRFDREAQATAGLASPHTIRLFDFGVSGDGTFYYVMELLDGVDLKTLIRRHGPLPAERVVHILRQICHSLHDAHLQGIIHRDIKPGNIFLCRYGAEFDFVKVLDFGLVKREEEVAPGQSQLTVDGLACGTPGFMAPEAMTSVDKVGSAADIYAVGCVGYWLLTGSLVFDGDSPMDIMVQHAKDDPVPPSQRAGIELPTELDRIILDCLAKAPGDRPVGARELSRRLESCAESVPDWSEDRAQRWWAENLPGEAGAVESRPTVGL